jgi:hypothetical protein
MLIYDFLFIKEKNFKSKIALFWLTLSLLFSLFYSYLALQQAFNSEYVIQDDARQHVFWMLRFTDGDLFPHDLIADYFQSVAPAGYSFLYWIINKIGIDPITFSKILPGILGLVVTGYCFALTLELLPLPFTGFVASLLLNQNLWLQDGLISGTPKAFAPPLLVAFLYYFLRRSVLGVSITILFFGLFYPSLVFICCGLLFISLFSLEFSKNRWQVRITNKKQDYIFAFTGLIVAFLILLPFAVATSEFSPTITVAQARALPEFMPGERAAFFNDRNPWDFWFNGSRSSLKVPSALMPPLAYLALFWTIITKRNRLKNKEVNWLKVNPQIKILPRLLLVSLLVFLIAHLLIFNLHLPSRYTQHSLRVIVILTASIVLTFIWEFLLKKISQRNVIQKTIYSTLALLLAVLLIFYPHTTDRFVWTRYVVGNEVALYKFLQQQPKDILIASLSEEADNLPSFARRSILVSREYAIPYHWGYYRPFRQRAVDLIEAQYSTDLTTIKNFIAKYNITHWLIENSAFSPEYLADNKWIKQHKPIAENVITNLQQGATPIIAKSLNNCSTYKSDRFTLLDSKCLTEK